MSTEEAKTDLSGVDLSGVVVDVSGVPQEQPKVAKKDMQLIDIVNEYLVAETKEIQLNAKVISMITKLLQHDSEKLGKIEVLFQKITEDKKINAKDIPELIEIIKELYTFFKQLYIRKVTADECGDILKLVIHLLVTYRLDEDEASKEIIMKELIEVLDGVVVACTGLIELKDNIPKGILKSLLICF